MRIAALDDDAAQVEAVERLMTAAGHGCRTFTAPKTLIAALRLSYGKIAGWTYRGVNVAPFTTFAGLYDRATGEEPFDLDARWIAAKAKLTPDTVFNISSTNDIIGGNSGSPLINAKTEVIGAVFDGNIHSLGGDYGYDGSINRSVTVSTTAISEALAKVYGAQALAAELAGS